MLKHAASKSNLKKMGKALLKRISPPAPPPEVTKVEKAVEKEEEEIDTAQLLEQIRKEELPAYDKLFREIVVQQIMDDAADPNISADDLKDSLVGESKPYHSHPERADPILQRAIKLTKQRSKKLKAQQDQAGVKKEEARLKKLEGANTKVRSHANEQGITVGRLIAQEASIHQATAKQFPDQDPSGIKQLLQELGNQTEPSAHQQFMGKFEWRQQLQLSYEWFCEFRKEVNTQGPNIDPARLRDMWKVNRNNGDLLNLTKSAKIELRRVGQPEWFRSIGPSAAAAA